MPCVFGLVGALAGLPSARAQESSPGAPPSQTGGTTVGVGVQGILAAPTLSLGGFAADSGDGAGLSVVVDLSKFRIEGTTGLAFAEGGAAAFRLGARFLFTVHQGDRSDLALGVGAGILHGSIGAGSRTRFHLEGAAQFRWFMTRNLAMTATAGLGLGFGDGGWLLALGGQPMGAFGLVYFF